MLHKRKKYATLPARSMECMSPEFVCVSLRRGTGREVAADERAAAGHMLMAAPVEETLQLAYPDVYLLDSSVPWGTEEQGQVGAGNTANNQAPVTGLCAVRV